MKISLEVEDFAELITEALRVELKATDENFLFKLPISNEEYLEVSLSKKNLKEILDRVESMDELNDTTLHNQNSYEVLVREHSNYGPPTLFRRDDLKQEDSVNDVEYILSNSSNEYLIFFLFKISQVAPIRAVFRHFGHRFRRYKDKIEGEPDIFDILRFSVPRLMTLKLTSEKKRTVSDFSQYADSFLFQICYNLDVAIVPQRYIEEVVRGGRITRNRRGDLEDIEAPRRHFESDLIYHYQMGSASDNPSLEFLSYYHIAEHFFELVFNEDLIEEVKSMITLPDFSYRRKRDIKKLIKSVTKRVQIQNETVTFNEKEALKLTFQKYVNLENLIKKIRNYDESLIEYYKKNEVGFTNGNRVDLESEDDESALASIATRIYRTRNAIVHSKEGDRGRYIPFQHDRILIKEVPLIRFISELIIVGTSKLISS